MIKNDNTDDDDDDDDDDRPVIYGRYHNGNN